MLANVLEDLGTLLMRKGAGDSALAMEREALGICLIENGSRDEGLPYLEAGYKGLTAACGEAHPLRVWGRSALENAGS